ncbi:MAG: hypothetical protein M3498_17350, partial [Deinococcota bacterium]|nr:hypothetical protein [Deinococcota bacterium]
MVDARSRFAARLEAGDVGLEAWTLVAVRGEEIFLVQHALELGPQRREGTVRALLLRGGRARRREARVQR